MSQFKQSVSQSVISLSIQKVSVRLFSQFRKSFASQTNSQERQSVSSDSQVTQLLVIPDEYRVSER